VNTESAIISAGLLVNREGPQDINEVKNRVRHMQDITINLNPRKGEREKPTKQDVLLKNANNFILQLT